MHSLVAARCMALYFTANHTAPLTLSHVAAGSVPKANMSSRSVTHLHSKHGGNVCALRGIPNVQCIAPQVIITRMCRGDSTSSPRTEIVGIRLHGPRSMTQYIGLASHNLARSSFTATFHVTCVEYVNHGKSSTGVRYANLLLKNKPQ